MGICVSASFSIFVGAFSFSVRIRLHLEHDPPNGQAHLAIDSSVDAAPSRWLLRVIRRNLLYQFGFEFDRYIVADDKSAGFRKGVPNQSKVLPIEFGRGSVDGPDVARG